MLTPPPHPERQSCCSHSADGGNGGSEGAKAAARVPCCLWLTSLVPTTLALAIPDSHKKEQRPTNTIKGDVGQEEAGVEAGGPEQVLQRVEENSGLRARMTRPFRLRRLGALDRSRPLSGPWFSQPGQGTGFLPCQVNMEVQVP